MTSKTNSDAQDMLLMIELTRDVVVDLIEQSDMTITSIAECAGIHRVTLNRFRNNSIDLSSRHIDAVLSALGYKIKIVKIAKEKSKK